MKFLKIKKEIKQEIKMSRKKIYFKDRQRRSKNWWKKGVPKEKKSMQGNRTNVKIYNLRKLFSN